MGEYTVSVNKVLDQAGLLADFWTNITMRRETSEEKNVKKIFKIRILVRFRDIDGMGHVNNAVFFTYFEEGRKAFFQKNSTDSDLSVFPFILAHTGCDFINPIRLNTQLSLEMWVKKIGNMSFKVFVTSSSRNPHKSPNSGSKKISFAIL